MRFSGVRGGIVHHCRWTSLGGGVEAHAHPRPCHRSAVSRRQTQEGTYVQLSSQPSNPAEASQQHNPTTNPKTPIVPRLRAAHRR